jgi:hypothetical protein
MIVYKFYLRDATEGDIFLGSLPERRKNPLRITEESIINWGRKYFGKNGKDEDIFFIKTVLEEGEKRFPNLSPEDDSRKRHKKVNSLFGFNQ